MNKSIISIIVNDKNVNLYTKLLIFLYYKAKNQKFNISDNEICKRLKLDIKKDRKQIYKTLKKIEEEKIIKINIFKRKRCFKWLLINEDNTINNNLNDLMNISSFDWLNSGYPQ